MGLDLALVGLVLVTAIRGWFKGFMTQAIRLGAIVAAVYVAAPLRDEVKSHAMQYLPSIRPDLIDRLLWWASAASSYVLIVGVASLALAISRRQTYGPGERGRGDQFAGFGLGLIKGAIVMAFALTSVQKHGEPHLAKIAMAAEQTRESKAWQWNRDYRPSDKIWALPPVQVFVNQIQEMGLRAPKSSESQQEVSARTEVRAPKMQLNGRRARLLKDREPEPDVPSDVGGQLEALQQQLQSLTGMLK